MSKKEDNINQKTFSSGKWLQKDHKKKTIFFSYLQHKHTPNINSTGGRPRSHNIQRTNKTYTYNLHFNLVHLLWYKSTHLFTNDNEALDAIFFL